MSIIRVKDRKWDCLDEATAQGATIDEFMVAFCSLKFCSICGEDIWKADFIYWSGEQQIGLCKQCAEHTLAGLNRDLLELHGDATVKKLSSSCADVILLRAENRRMQQLVLERLRQVITLQDLLARRP